MIAKPGRNDPCPCGSGKKFKKCCGNAAETGFSRIDRERAFDRLTAFVAEELGHEDDLAFDELWGRWLERADEFSEALDEQSESVFDPWMFFDRPLPDGQRAVEVLIATDGGIGVGERNFLTMMQSSAMHLWEVEDVLPGVSLSLRDVLENTRITVQERSASRTLARHEWIVARVVPRGASGAPEIERGVLHIPQLFHGGVRDQLTGLRAQFLRDNPGANLQAFYKDLPPFFHDLWAGSILEPTVPELHNTDGERLLLTRISYDVLDRASLEAALKANGELETESEGDAESSFGWTGSNQRGEVVSLGRFELRGKSLVVEVNSVERGERARHLLESSAGPCLRHRATTHEDLTRRVRDGVREKILGGDSAPDRDRQGAPESEIPPEVGEALVLSHLARHYRAWLDESIPALAGKSPRNAATDPTLRGKLVDLIHGLENHYERALKTGQPAYDPSWMWADLGLDESTQPASPPPLAHERIALCVPGSAELCRRVAEAERQKPGFSDASTLLSEEECRQHLDLRRFLREREGAANDGGTPNWDVSRLAPYLPLMVNFDLHRRKAFWVDESLAFLLAHTDLDALGRELRAPFPSFALVFTDRHVLSLGERLLSRDRECPVSGHILRVATVYVVEHDEGERRAFALSFAFDALGADPPALVHCELRLGEEARVQDRLDALCPRVIVGPPVEDRNPLRGLLTVVVNAILYATNPGAEPELRRPEAAARRPRTQRGAPAVFTSEEVYFLPGAIEISALRGYQALERLPDGRSILQRFMVRGHWRRAQKTWADQRMRWVAPYWKGPDMAAIIERTYRLTP